ncbi:MAG: DNA-binding protein [Desulfovibrio sp.]|nr:DNA-binding protein [Desulfovibrio sp.]|tara:strand:+ start:661 stop:894 length:234 start_codon:yes stop_codon:yes gene_type:complete
MSKYYGTKQAAQYLGGVITPGTLEVWRCYGKGPRYAKLGRRVVYLQADLDSFVELGKVETIDTVNPIGKSKSCKVEE